MENIKEYARRKAQEFGHPQSNRFKRSLNVQQPSLSYHDHTGLTLHSLAVTDTIPMVVTVLLKIYTQRPLPNILPD